jgi:hypothetical protein
MKLYSSFIFLLLIATMSSAGIKKQRKHLLGVWQVESVDLSSMLLKKGKLQNVTQILNPCKR